MNKEEMTSAVRPEENPIPPGIHLAPKPKKKIIEITGNDALPTVGTILDAALQNKDHIGDILVIAVLDNGNSVFQSTMRNSDCIWYLEKFKGKILGEE